MLKKMMSLILSALLMMFSLSAASASEVEPGLFATLAQDELGDERLAVLDETAEQLSLSLTTEGGVAVELSQACLEDDHVFVSYRIGANTDLMVLHEGAPDGKMEWTTVLEDWIPAEIVLTGYPDVDRENAWLDGKGQRWLEAPVCAVREGLDLEDGTRLPFVAGSEMKLADGSVIGWRECVIPDETAADTMTFTLVITCESAVKFQDYSTFKGYWNRLDDAGIVFTLTRK